MWPLFAAIGVVMHFFVTVRCCYAFRLPNNMQFTQLPAFASPNRLQKQLVCRSFSYSTPTQLCAGPAARGGGSSKKEGGSNRKATTPSKANLPSKV